MCASKWNDADFKLKTVAEELKGTLAQCGLINVELGHTYLPDRLSDAGLPIQSSLDHIYRSVELEDNTTGSKLTNTSTDHVPIMISITDAKAKPAPANKICKRSMKNFNPKY